MKKRASSSSKPSSKTKAKRSSATRSVARTKAKSSASSKSKSRPAVKAARRSASKKSVTKPLLPQPKLAAKVAALKDFVWTKPIVPAETREIIVTPVIAENQTSILPVPLDETPQAVENRLAHPAVTELPASVRLSWPPLESPASRPATNAWQDSPAIIQAGLEDRLSLESKRILMRVWVTVGMIIILGIWAYSFRQIVTSTPSFKNEGLDQDLSQSLDSMYKDVNQQLDSFRLPPSFMVTEPNTNTSTPELTPEQIELLKQNLPSNSAPTPTADPIQP